MYPSGLVSTGQNSIDHEGSPQRYKGHLTYNYLILHNMKALLNHHRNQTEKSFESTNEHSLESLWLNTPHIDIAWHKATLVVHYWCSTGTQRGCGRPLAITEVIIKSGIHQSDALLTLLFCIGFNPLTQHIAKSRSGVIISHQLHPVQGWHQQWVIPVTWIDSLIHVTKIYEDIGISFGLDKKGNLDWRDGAIKSQVS